jgi:WD40 repeat protein
VAAKSSPASPCADPDPSRVATARDFGRELALARARAGLTVRQLAAKAGVPNGTVSGYLTGEHLPQPTYLEPLHRILAVCGENAPHQVAAWDDAARRARRAPGRRPVDARSPYRGLSSFQVEDADLFKGRAALTRLVVERLRRSAAEGCGMLFVVGASGAGKSSLLRAGVVPVLQRGGHQVTIIVPGSRPCRALPDRSPLAGSVLIVDQFEEVFAQEVCAAERQRFIDGLCKLIADGGLVLLGMRADFYPQALEHPALANALQASQVVVGPMSPADLREAIVAPARQLSLDVDDGLVEVIVRDLAPPAGAAEGMAHDAGALPLLSHALLAAWQRSRGGRLTFADYLAGGGVEGSIAQAADAAFAELTPQQQAAAQGVFLRLVHIGDGVWDTRRRMAPAEIRHSTAGSAPGDVQAVLDRFVAARLVTVDDTCVQITHEALLRAWPRLRSWLDTDRDWLRMHRRLTNAAAEWEETGRDPDRLYGSGVLQAMRVWVDERGYRSTLNPAETDFLDASARARALDAAKARRRTRRRYTVVALLTALLVTTVSSAAFTAQLLGNRDREHAQALSRYLADESNRLRGHDVALSMQLALVAYRIWPTQEARASLLDSTSVPAGPRLRPDRGPATALAVHGGGGTFAAGTAAGTVNVWATRPSLDYSTPTRVLTGAHGQIRAAAFTPDGAMLAAGSSDGTVYLWNMRATAQPRTLTAPCDSVNAVAITDDGRVLAEGCSDGAVYLWRIPPDGRAVLQSRLRGAGGPVVALDTAAGGHVLAVAHKKKVIRLWDITDVAHPVPDGAISTVPTEVFSVAISPDGRTLAAATSEGHSVELWTITDPRHPSPSHPALTGPAGWVSSVAFSPDGRTIAAGSADGMLWLFDLATRRAIQKLPHPRPVTAADYTAADALVTLADDGTIRTWHPPGPQISSLKDIIFALSYDNSGHKLGIGPGAGDNTLTVWDTTAQQNPRLLGPPITNPLKDKDARFSGSGALTPDGKVFAVGDTDGTAQLFDISNPATTRSLGPPLNAATSLVEAVSADHRGRLLAVSNDDGTVPIYDISDPRHPALLSTLPTTAPGSYTYQASFSPDDRLLAVADSDHHGYLWNVSNPTHPRRLATLGGFTDAVYTTAFMPDAQMLAVGSEDGTVRLWDIAQPDRPANMGQVLTGPMGYIYSIAYDPAQHLLAVAGSTDGTIWLWDMTNPHAASHLATLTGPTNGVMIVAFSPDGRTLLAGGHDHTIRLWNIDETTAATWICANTGLEISPQEWAQYVPGRNYEPPCRQH